MNVLSSNLDKMSNYFFKRAEVIAEIEGEEFGSANTPSVDEYQKYMGDINPLSDEIYRYLNFNEIDTYVESANNATIPAVNIVNPA